MKRLVMPAPPEFAETLGYEGEGRYVAFWWTPYGDELCYADGTSTLAGATWTAWLAFSQHPLTRAVLAVAAGEESAGGYDFGNSESEAVHALLVDRWEQTLDVCTVREAEQFLRTQPSPLAAVQQAYDLSDEQVIAQLTAAYEAQLGQDPQELLAKMQDKMERDRRLHEQMVRWLDRLQHNTENAS